MKLLEAPDKYDRDNEQRVRAAISEALEGVFVKGEDVRLLRGERFSLHDSDGVEVFFSVDGDSILDLFAKVGAVSTTVWSATPQTISAPGHYVNSGAAVTWTLPAVASSIGWVIWIKNRGSGSITLNRAGSDNIYDTSAVTSITILAGGAARLVNDGTYWLLE